MLTVDVDADAQDEHPALGGPGAVERLGDCAQLLDELLGFVR
jgi:hypothetical protein